MKNKILPLTAALACFTANAHAAIILSDSLAITAGGADYNTGALQNQTATVGTTGYAAAWSGGTTFNDITTGGLTHSAMTGTALEGRLRSLNGTNNANARSLFRGINYTATTGTYYFSALFSKSTQASADMYAGLGTATSHQTNITNGGFATIGIRQGGLAFLGTTIVTAANFATDKTYIGVMEINYDSAGADSVTASFYNDSAVLVGTQTFTGLSISADNMQSLAVGTATSGANNAFVDEIRFGTALADVFNPIPEPSAALLGGLGFLMLLRRRRA